MHKEYEALRLRNQLDPKRFYRKDPGEGRGIKALPKHFAVRLHTGPANYYFFPTQCPFARLGRLSQPTHRLVDLVGTTYRALLASAHWSTNWSTMRRHATTPNASLTTFKLHAPRKVAGRSQRGMLPESPSGKRISQVITARVEFPAQTCL